MVIHQNRLGKRLHRGDPLYKFMLGMWRIQV